MTNATGESQPAAREEGFLHYVAREGRTALRWIMVFCVIATFASIVSPLWMLSVVPAALLFVCYALLILTNAVEKRSDVAAHDALERSETAYEDDVVEDHTEDHQLPEVQKAVVKREGTIAVIVIAAVLLVAVILARIWLPGAVVAIGAFVVFAYMLLVTTPVWLGAFEDDIEDTTERLSHAPTSEPEE